MKSEQYFRHKTVIIRLLHNNYGIIKHIIIKVHNNNYAILYNVYKTILQLIYVYK